MKRQLLVYRTDLICLQGLDMKQSGGASLAAALAEEGYGTKLRSSLETRLIHRHINLYISSTRLRTGHYI